MVDRIERLRIHADYLGRQGRRSLAADLRALLDSMSAPLAWPHRAVSGNEANGTTLIHGCCVCCLVPWPCPSQTTFDEAVLLSVDADMTAWHARMEAHGWGGHSDGTTKEEPCPCEPEIELAESVRLPWCEGGPPVTLLDAVRSVMQPGGGLDRPRSMTPLEVLSEIHERWPGGWPLCTVIDVADELRGFYG